MPIWTQNPQHPVAVASPGRPPFPRKKSDGWKKSCTSPNTMRLCRPIGRHGCFFGPVIKRTTSRRFVIYRASWGATPPKEGMAIKASAPSSRTIVSEKFWSDKSMVFVSGQLWVMASATFAVPPVGLKMMEYVFTVMLLCNDVKRKVTGCTHYTDAWEQCQIRRLRKCWALRRISSDTT